MEYKVLLAARLSEERVEIKIEEDSMPAIIESDRVILRQILIEIVNTLLNFKTRQLTFEILKIQDQIVLSIKSTIPVQEGNLRCQEKMTRKIIFGFG